MDPCWEDVEDDMFLRQMSSDPLLEMKDNVQNVEKLCLESAKRSLTQLAETELVGLNTAEELVRNRDSMKHISSSLDGISADLKRSQRHIDSVRSVFSTVKNSLFGKKKPSQTVRPDKESDTEERQIDSYLSKQKKNELFYSFPWRDENKDMLTSLQGRVLTGDIACSRNPFNTAGDADVEQSLDSLSSAVGRLKGLATAMGEEIETQNSALDLINEKTTKIHVKMAEQGKAIEKIIK